MESAKLKLIRFDKSDVIATSGLFTLSGVDNGINDDLNFTGDHEYDTIFRADNDSSHTYCDFEEFDSEDEMMGSGMWGIAYFNGSYKWDNDYQCYRKVNQ